MSIRRVVIGNGFYISMGFYRTLCVLLKCSPSVHNSANKETLALKPCLTPTWKP